MTNSEKTFVAELVSRMGASRKSSLSPSTPVISDDADGPNIADFPLIRPVTALTPGVEQPRAKVDLVLVPREPPRTLLVSMAFCLDHAFGLLPPAEKEERLRKMAKIHAEIVGDGYHGDDNADWYESVLSDDVSAPAMLAPLPRLITIAVPVHTSEDGLLAHD